MKDYTCPFKMCVLKVQKRRFKNYNRVKLFKILSITAIWEWQYIAVLDLSLGKVKIKLTV